MSLCDDLAAKLTVARGYVVDAGAYDELAELDTALARYRKASNNEAS